MGTPLGEGARRLAVVGLALVLGGALGAAAAYTVPERYASTADVLLTPKNAASGTAIAPETTQSLAIIAAGQTIARQVEKHLNLTEPVGTRLSATAVKDSSIVRIKGVAETPEGAAGIAKRASGTFVTWSERQEEGAAKDVSASIVAPAAVPENEIYPPRWSWPVGGAALGLLVGFGIPARRRAEQAPVLSVDDLREDSTAPVLGVLGHEDDLTSLPLISTLPAGHPAAEAIRIVRTNLRYVDDEEHLRVIAVTSSIPAEGKSTTSCNLGISLAQTGRTVVILEGDLRRPQLAQYMGVDSTFGVTSVLTGQLSVESAVQHSRVPGLDVLTSGPMPSNPAEVLQTDAMADLITDLRDMYDIVLIDAPPVLPVADAPLLAANSDGVLLLAKHGSTGRDQIRAAVERINAVDGEVVGAVLTMSPRKSTQRYGYGYGYGSEAEAKQGRGRRSSRSHKR